jgi:hypothetical protein
MSTKQSRKLSGLNRGRVWYDILANKFVLETIKEWDDYGEGRFEEFVVKGVREKARQFWSNVRWN